MTLTDTTTDAPSVNRRTGRDGPEFSESVLEVLAVPELSFAVLAVGITALACCLALEASSWQWLPGIGLLGAGLVGATTMPAAPAGMMLVALAVISFGLEVLAYPGMALHAAGGAVSLMLSGLYLTETPPGVHPTLAALVGLASGAAVLLAARRSPRRAREDPFASSADRTGHTATVLAAEGTTGCAVVCGELWVVRAQHARLHSGQEVRVTHCSERYLVVEPLRSRR